MGAVNYYTSDYITLGLRPYDVDDFTSDQGFMQEIKKEVEEYGGTVEEAVNDYISGCYESDYSNIEFELKKHNFWYYHITIKPGYYEGFTLDIENNFPVAFDNWEDKRDAQKEITEIKDFLIACAGMGLVACYPGWCTGYNDYKGTIKAIKAAIKEMREEARTIPAWRQYEKGVLEMRLYEDIGTKYKYHGVIEGLGVAGNVYANSFRDLKRKASETANNYFRPVDVLQVWNSQGKDNKPLFKLYRRNNKTPCNTFVPGVWK